jgi:hypothetical protein
MNDRKGDLLAMLEVDRGELAMRSLRTIRPGTLDTLKSVAR